jgi:hypothetical protein
VHRGDLSDRLPPRWLFVYEGVVGNLPVHNERRYRLATQLRQWKRAAACFETEVHVRKVLWDLYWRRDYRFDVVTFLGDEMAEAIDRRLDRESLPVGNVRSWQPDELARQLVFMPDVQYVVHGDPKHHLTYGNKGLLVTDPSKLALF